MGRLIFLDFDGVLRRSTSSPSCFDQDCLSSFEAALRNCLVSKVVITSTWRLAMPMKDIRDLFSKDIASRIIGKTPELLEEVPYIRYAEILAFLNEKKISSIPWVAIDDDPLYFPSHAPVIYTDPLKGFDSECAIKLENILLSRG